MRVYPINHDQQHSDVVKQIVTYMGEDAQVSCCIIMRAQCEPSYSPTRVRGPWVSPWGRQGSLIHTGGKPQAHAAAHG